MASTHSRVLLPRLLQTSANESGAVSLGIVLACFGKHLTIAELRQLSGTNHSGTTPEKLLLAIHDCGLNGNWVDCSSGDLSIPQVLTEQPLPAIIHEGNGKFQAILEFNDHTALIYSPSHGLHQLPADAVAIEIGRAHV